MRLDEHCDRGDLTKRLESCHFDIVAGRCSLSHGQGRVVDVRNSFLQLGGNVPAIAVSLFVMWLLGSVSSYTMGGYLHTFLVAGIALIMPRLVLGRKGAD
jgi:uncharacterized protein DUF5670